MRYCLTFSEKPPAMKYMEYILLYKKRRSSSVQTFGSIWNIRSKYRYEKPLQLLY